MHSDAPSFVVPVLGRWAGRPCWQWQDGTVLPRISGGDGSSAAAGDGNSGGDGGSGDSGAGGTGSGDGGGTGDAGSGSQSKFDAITTQADFDRAIQDRLNRQKAQFKDYDDFKAKAAKFDELDAKSKSDLEKAQEAATKAASERDAALAAVTESTKRNAVIAAAAAAKAADPNDVFALLPQADKDALTIGDDGQVTGAEDAVKRLLEAKPHLVGKAGMGSAEGGSRGDTPGQLSRDDLKTMSSAEIVKAKADGRLKGLLGAT
jgi:hypothetical protein